MKKTTFGSKKKKKKKKKRDFRKIKKRLFGSDKKKIKIRLLEAINLVNFLLLDGISTFKGYLIPNPSF